MFLVKVSFQFIRFLLIENVDKNCVRICGFRRKFLFAKISCNAYPMPESS